MWIDAVIGKIGSLCYNVIDLVIECLARLFWNLYIHVVVRASDESVLFPTGVFTHSVSLADLRIEAIQASQHFSSAPSSLTLLFLFPPFLSLSLSAQVCRERYTYVQWSPDKSNH